jgi:hypothetical protein
MACAADFSKDYDRLCLLAVIMLSQKGLFPFTLNFNILVSNTIKKNKEIIRK